MDFYRNNQAGTWMGQHLVRVSGSPLRICGHVWVDLKQSGEEYQTDVVVVSTFVLKRSWDLISFYSTML